MFFLKLKSLHYWRVLRAITKERYEQRNFSRVKEQAILAEIAKNHHTDEIRRKAFKKLNNPQILTEIVRSDSSEQVRIAAIGQLTDDKFLTEITHSDPSERIRLAAISRLNNWQTLVEITRSDASKRVRLAAVRQLSDWQALAEIARSDASEQVRLAALELLYDWQVLIAIACSDTSEQVRKMAIRRLPDETLAELDRSDLSGQIRVAAYAEKQRRIQEKQAILDAERIQRWESQRRAYESRTGLCFYCQGKGWTECGHFKAYHCAQDNCPGSQSCARCNGSGKSSEY